MPIMDREENNSVLTPQEVRNILHVDNKEIVSLCKKISIIPKKNSKGQTYFSQEEVEKLKKAQKTSNTTAVISKVDSNAIVNSLLMKLQTMEERLSDKVSTVIDEKLDGMDEVVVELIRCKTENETLRQKLNELNKENYQLKNEVTSFKNIGLGLYIKKKIDDFSI